jgi:translation elongation factor P/translation initiation factor 5A
LNISVFIGRTDQEILNIKNILNSIADEEEFKNIVFVVVEDFLTKEVFDKFIEYRSRAVVSERHDLKDDKNTNDAHATKVIDDWIYKIKRGYVEWHLENKNGKELASGFGDLINSEISGRVFRFGLETLDQLRWNAPIWKFKAAKAAIDTFLFADSRHDAENETSKGQGKYLRGIINNNRGGEYTVSESLEIKPDADENHPIVKMSAEIGKKMETNKNKGTFHLGEVLKFLSKPPYGLYTNMVNMAAMGFLMRPFVGRLYEKGTGKPLEKEMMRDKITSLFNYWQKGTDSDKLEVRFGTDEEKELINILKDVFKLQGVNSLNNTRWEIRKWVNDAEYPLWVFKVSCDDDKTKKAVDNIVWLIRSIDKEINQKKIKESLDLIKYASYDLCLLIKREQARGLFTKWLKDIEDVSIRDEDVKTVVDFLNQNTQENVALWDEEKVGSLVMKWELKRRTELDKNMANTEMEGELVDILTDVFKLQDVDGLTDARLKVKEWVNYAKYPLWAFKVSCDDDATKKGIDRIVWLIKSTNSDVDQKEINESLDSLKYVHHNLTLLINRAQAEELFIRWLKNIENVNISDEEVETVVDFLNQNMRAEVASWDENKVRERVKDWGLKKATELKKNKANAEIEDELVDILTDVFKLQDVDGLTDARSKVKEWVNDVKYPLWAFKVSCDDNATKKGIDRIVWLIKSTNSDIDQKELNKSLYYLKDVGHGLALLIKSEQAKELFTKWLKDIEKVSISDKEIETVVDFLNQNMQAEVASWDENKVRERVKDWRLEEKVEPEGNDEQVKEMKRRIQNYPSRRIKDLLIELVDRHPELCGWLEVYLE